MSEDTRARLDEIKARADDCRSYNFGMRNADRLAHEDAPNMAAALTAVLDRHKKEPARYYGTDLNPHNEFDCQGCGEGKSWPCPTVARIADALA